MSRVDISVLKANLISHTMEVPVHKINITSAENEDRDNAFS